MYYTKYLRYKTLEILRLLGCKIIRKNGKIIIDSNNMNKTEIPSALMHKLRSSIILAGALVGRFKKQYFHIQMLTWAMVDRLAYKAHILDLSRNVSHRYEETVSWKNSKNM